MPKVSKFRIDPSNNYYQVKGIPHRYLIKYLLWLTSRNLKYMNVTSLNLMNVTSLNLLRCRSTICFHNGRTIERRNENGPKTKKSETTNGPMPLWPCLRPLMKPFRTCCWPQEMPILPPPPPPPPPPPHTHTTHTTHTRAHAPRTTQVASRGPVPSMPYHNVQEGKRARNLRGNARNDGYNQTKI